MANIIYEFPTFILPLLNEIIGFSRKNNNIGL